METDGLRCWNMVTDRYGEDPTATRFGFTTGIGRGEQTGTGP